jgi:peptidoglycan/LPS O-acetylase OafA/YrhL
MAMPGAAAERIDYFDSLRGLAALSVVFSHFFMGFGWPAALAAPMTNSPLHLFWDGRAAVSLFFVLSGLVLSVKYVGGTRGDQHRTLTLIPFYIARIFRIGLPYVLALALSWIAQALFFTQPATDPAATDWLHQYWTKPVTGRLFSNEAFLFLKLPNAMLMPQGWTLTVEMNLSLLLPFLVIAVQRSTLWLIALCGVGIVIFGLPIYVVHFMLGVLIARHFPRVKSVVAELGRGGRLALLLLALAGYSFRFWLPPHVPFRVPDTVIWWVTGFGSAGILIFAMGSVTAQGVLRKRALLYLGRISYSLYLCHFAVILAMTWPLMAGINQIGVFGNPARLLALIGTVALSIGVSELLYRLAEAPSIRIGKRLGSAWEERGLPTG